MDGFSVSVIWGHEVPCLYVPCADAMMTGWMASPSAEGVWMSVERVECMSFMVSCGDGLDSGSDFCEGRLM